MRSWKHYKIRAGILGVISSLKHRQASSVIVIKCLVVVVWFYDLPIGLCDTVQSPEVRGVFSTI